MFFTFPIHISTNQPLMKEMNLVTFNYLFFSIFLRTNLISFFINIYGFVK